MENAKSNLSVIILTKNEAEMIEKCIDSVKELAPLEVLLIDDGSIDNTKELVKKKNVLFISHKKKDFADARNFGLEKAKGDWILYLDADERLSIDLINEIKIVIKTSKFCAYKLIRQNYYLGKKWPKTEKIIRLFQKKSLINWFGEVHESPKINGDIGELNSSFFHYTHQNLGQMIETTLVWSKIEANLRFKAKHPQIVWWRFPRVMIPVFLDYYIYQGGWKLGSVGLIESIYQSFSIFISYARLWEMQQKKV